MKKIAILTMVATTVLTTSIGFASPLHDYSPGKTVIDLNFRNADVDANASAGGNNVLSQTFGKKSNIDWGITTGLGNKIAFQYNGYDAKSKDAVMYRDGTETNSMNFTLKTQEFNVLYQLDKNVSVYTGLVKTQGSYNQNDTYDGITTSTGSSTNRKNKIQFGLVGSTKLADKTTAYAQIGVASDFTNWKIGVSQEIAPNLEFNVDYRRIQVKNLDNSGTNVDITAKGFGFGASYKF